MGKTTVGRGFTKEPRVTIISRNMTDNSCGEFYNPVKSKTVANLKSIGSGPARFKTSATAFEESTKTGKTVKTHLKHEANKLSDAEQI